MVPAKPGAGTKVIAPVAGSTLRVPSAEVAVSVTLAGSIAPPTWVSLPSTGVVTGMPALVVAPSSLARMDTTGVLRIVLQRGSPVPAGHSGPLARAVLRTTPASASAWVTV